jgi:hypothetical protein
MARTAKISERGLFLLVDRGCGLAEAGELIVELSRPASEQCRCELGAACYRCRVVRTRVLGQLLGLGVEFTE